MLTSNRTPSIVPGDERHACLVIDDLGRLGRVYREADVEAADLETVLNDLLEGQYSNPLRVISFNADEGWSRDISADVAAELRRRCDLQLTEPPAGIHDFLERHEGIVRRSRSASSKRRGTSGRLRPFPPRSIHSTTRLD